jgi:hypothetical protein
MRTGSNAQATVLRASGAAVALFLATLTAHAGEAAIPLEVKVNLSSGEKPPEIGLCRAAESGATVTVSCQPIPAPTPTPITTVPGRRLHFSNVRFYLSGTGDWLGTVDESMGLGTVTSWRVIRLANRDYLEMMVGW